MGSSEKFCLRWNDFESNISVAFREIREEKDFFDCTLSVGDRQLQAHKLILSACSPFFRSVLRKNPHAHPLLYLKGVEFSDLQAVLNFMYHGEVNVAQEELNSFLAVAEDLKVKGLTQNNSSGDSNSTPKHPRTTEPPRASSAPRAPAPRLEEQQPPAPKRPRPAPTQYEDDDIQEVMPVVKTEPMTAVVPEPPQVQQQVPAVSGYQGQTGGNQGAYQGVGQVAGGALAHMEDQSYGEEDGYDYGGYEGEEGYEGMEGGAVGDNNKGPSDYIVRHPLGNNEGVPQQFTCGKCGKLFNDMSNCRRHIKSVHFTEVPEKCEICGNILKNKNSLKCHMRQYHPEIKSNETMKIWM